MPNKTSDKKMALVIDDDEITLELLSYQLKAEGFDVTTANTGTKGLTEARKQEFDILLTDLNLPDISGIEMVRQCKEMWPGIEIIMVTGDDSTERAVEAIKLGARDYIVKTSDPEKLFVAIRNAMEARSQSQINAEQAAEIERLKKTLSSTNSYQGIIGGAKPMQNIYEIIENVAESDANILILGESGVGKEVIANAVHFKSHRKNKPFIKVNCSALPKDLIESQLFGHVKGSFTGAHSDKTGFIGQAAGGSLLLDEIGEMPIDLQPKLLRVLQEKVYYRVGSDRPQEADFRLICSTNRTPFEAIQEGLLREDLYYRINTIEINIPPLRERMDDVPMLAEHFLKEYAEKYNRTDAEFTQGAYNQMLNYNWRGNVRELQHAIERAVLLSKGNQIDRLNIDADAETTPASTRYFDMAASAAPIGGGTAAAAVSSAAVSVFPTDGPEMFEKIGEYIVQNIPERDEGAETKDIFEDVESGIVLAALKRTNGNKQAAANLLGLYRPRLYGMIKRHNIEERLDAS